MQDSATTDMSCQNILDIGTFGKNPFVFLSKLWKLESKDSWEHTTGMGLHPKATSWDNLCTYGCPVQDNRKHLFEPVIIFHGKNTKKPGTHAHTRCQSKQLLCSIVSKHNLALQQFLKHSLSSCSSKVGTGYSSGSSTVRNLCEMLVFYVKGRHLQLTSSLQIMLTFMSTGSEMSYLFITILQPPEATWHYCCCGNRCIGCTKNLIVRGGGQARVASSQQGAGQSVTLLCQADCAHVHFCTKGSNWYSPLDHCT